MGEEVIGGSDYQVVFRLPENGSYIKQVDLANLYAAVVGAGGTVYDRYSLNAKEGYLKVLATGPDLDTFELYVSSVKTQAIADAGDSCKIQINIVRNEDTQLIADGKKNTVVYFDTPNFVKPLTTVETT